MPAESLLAFVRLPRRVDEGGVVRECRFEVGDDRQRLVVDFDQGCSGLRDLGGRGGDSGNDVAFEADGVSREQPAVLNHAAVQNVGHILVGHDREDTRKCPGLARVDPGDPRMRVVGVAELGHQLAGEHDVGRVATGACHLLLAVRTDERPGFLDRRHRWLSFVDRVWPYPIREGRAAGDVGVL